jgi:hypothetical protein
VVPVPNYLNESDQHFKKEDHPLVPDQVDAGPLLLKQNLWETLTKATEKTNFARYNGKSSK